jgi:hypothetical protein
MKHLVIITALLVGTVPASARNIMDWKCGESNVTITASPGPQSPPDYTVEVVVLREKLVSPTQKDSDINVKFRWRPRGEFTGPRQSLPERQTLQVCSLRLSENDKQLEIAAGDKGRGWGSAELNRGAFELKHGANQPAN